MKQIRVTFPCGELSLEGVCHLPEGRGPFPAVIVCHPHPLYGGNMDSYVVVAVCRALCENGIISFRFNFRGVGRSEGTLGGGVGEPDDVRAAVSFVASMEQVDSKRIGLCGYSAGVIAPFSTMPQDERVQAIAAISPPVSFGLLEGFKAFPKPKLVISGSRDDFTPLQDLRRFVESLPEPKECEVIPGADHFWGGYEQRVGERVASFFVSALKG
ncbi:MAG: dienelactone hydrolase family protein [Dehalococcoidia bacterium]|nr:dienelactone hydrolase family protein [Dehalococcoidia bacterium]